MANKRIKDIITASTSFASDDFVITDSATSGTRKMTKDDLVSQVTADVNSIAQDAEANGTKLVGPSIHFGGSAYVTITSDSKLSFAGSGNDLPFTFSCWTKLPASSPSGTVFFSKWISAAEYSFQTTSAGNLILYLSDGTNTPFVKASTALPTEQWVHVCGTYAGTTGGAFSSAANGLTLYVNGEAVTATQTNKPAYSGMNAGSDALQISRLATTNYEQTIRDARIFNKALTASEVKALCLSGSMPESFADSTGGAEKATDGDMETSGTGSWTGTTTITKETADPYAGTQNLKSLGEAGKRVEQNMGLVTGKRYRASFRYRTGGTSFSPQVRLNGGTWDTIHTLTASASWAYATVEFVPNSANNPNGVFTFYNASGADATSYLELDDVSVVDVGAVLDARAEQFDTSTGKLYDLSDNDFVGTNNGATLLGREFPVYITGTWSGSIEFGGASTGQTYAANNCNYTRTGNVVHVQGIITLLAKGSSTGTARIAGLPFTSSSDASQAGLSIHYGTGFASLTSLPSALVSGSATTALVCNWGASGITALTESNFTDATSIRFSGSYKIS